ncbi:MAG: hypothetical protein WKG07_00320 [Hymenobacter sp.]
MLFLTQPARWPVHLAGLLALLLSGPLAWAQPAGPARDLDFT